MRKQNLLKIFITALILLCSFPSLPTAAMQDGETSVKLMSGLGEHHHQVSTKSAEAQQYFDQGLNLIYAFNHDEAARSFARAAELDPNLAMAYWGVALANGTNYNRKADHEHLQTAYEAISRAIKLLGKATDPEQDYIQALSTRYSSIPNVDQDNLEVTYKDAMGRLAKKYPDDLDAATLYAESIMNLRPWRLWTGDGKPAEGTEEIVRVVESVLSRNSDHPGANHYYIHAVEASPHPEYGLACARRLPALMPGAGHVVHMSSHIYFRVGEYGAAANANQQAIAVDQEFFKDHSIKSHYATMYYFHNIYFLAQAQCMQGRFAEAKEAADSLASLANPQVADMPMLAGFVAAPPMVLVRFRRFDDILASPSPGEKPSFINGVWHYARALAYLSKDDKNAAEKERQHLQKSKMALPEDSLISLTNSGKDILVLAQLTLDAKFAVKAGDRTRGIKLLREALKRESELNYAEPPDWILPVAESLGALLLRDGQAAEAERVFRTGLVEHPRSGRCLFGLRESLRAQKNDYAASQIDQEFQRAWKNAGVKELRLEDLEQ